MANKKKGKARQNHVGEKFTETEVKNSVEPTPASPPTEAHTVEVITQTTTIYTEDNTENYRERPTNEKSRSSSSSHSAKNNDSRQDTRDRVRGNWAKQEREQNSARQPYKKNAPSSQNAGKTKRELKKHNSKTMKQPLDSLLKDVKKAGTQRIKESIHSELSAHEKDNAGIELGNKVERLGEQTVKTVGRAGKKAVRKGIEQRKFLKKDIVELENQFGKGHSKKELAKMAYSKGFKTDAKLPRSEKLKGLATRQMSASVLGTHIAEKTGATLLGKAAGKGGSALKFGTSQASTQIRGKLEQAGADNSAVQVMNEGVKVAEVPAKYALKQGGKGVKKAVVKSPVGRAWNKSKQAVRKMLANQQRKFLLKHPTVAKARGVIMKSKAIVKELLIKTRPVLIWLGVVVLAAVVIQAILAPTIGLLKAGTEQTLMSTYPSSNGDITSSTSQWKGLEVELLQEIDNVPTTHPGYDAYEYDIDPMKYNPFELMAFLSAMNLDFTHPDVANQILALFQEQNELEFIEKSETKYDSDGDPYEYKTLITKLKPLEFEDVIRPKLQGKEGAEEMYDIYMGSGGNRQLFGNPFPTDWRQNISYPYGARSSPTGVGYDVHGGLDIAYPAGTPMQSVQNGVVVVSGWHDLYGNYIVIRDVDDNTSLYAHCSTLEVSVGDIVRQGNLIATVGMTGNTTGNHLHIEIKIKGERVDPVFFLGYSKDEEEINP